MMHVIIGVGAAGITAAKTIRSQQPDASITMISTDEHVHSRCMLHRYLSQKIKLFFLITGLPATMTSF